MPQAKWWVCWICISVENFHFSELCGLDLPKWKTDRLRHYECTHEVTAEEAKEIASSPGSLSSWRKVNGFTSIPGQCGFCLKVVPGYGIHRHRRSCKNKNESNSCTSESTPSSSSTFEEIVNDSGPVLNSLMETQKTAELQSEVKKLTKQKEQLKDSKVNKLLAKSKSRVTKLESKVKLLKAENKKLSEKYVKLLETLLAKQTAT